MSDNEKQARASLEAIGDQIEGNMRAILGLNHPMTKEAFRLAWDLKQLARRGTPSEGI